MKKITIIGAACLCMLMSGCGALGTTGTTTTGSTGSNSNGGGLLGSVLGALGSASTVNSLANLVIGSVKLSESDLYGTWKYREPACAFTSENLLAKAGGAVAAAQVNEKLLPVYNQVGIKSSNTYFTFNKDHSFEAKVNGIPLSGSWTYDQAASAVKMKTMLMSMTGYVTRTTSGLSYTFESKKLLTVLQTLSSLSGNSTLQAVGDLSKNYEGVRVGFDMKK